MSRSQLTSTVEQNSGGAVAGVTAGKNILINGAFDIWQRGTSFASGGYMADRWTDDSTVSNMTASQQTSGAPNGSRYILRYTATGASAYKNIIQYIETAQAAQAWGNTLTFSIKMRRNATATGGNLGWSIQKSATVDAGSGSTWSSLGNSNTVLSSLTTGTTSADWTIVTISAVIPNDGTANSLRVTAGFGAAQASGAIVEFAQAQLEIGSVATPFARAGGTIAGELAACQRYYYALAPANSSTKLIGPAFMYGAAQMDATIYYVTTMRTSPTLVQTVGTDYYGMDRSAGTDTFSNFTQYANSPNACLLYNNSEMSGTQGAAGYVYTNNAAASIAFNAEIG